MTTKRVALFGEDRNFVDFLVPVVESVAQRTQRRIEWCARAPLHGCRGMQLRHEIERVAAMADLVIVGADAAGRHHASRGRGHRRKAAELRSFLGNQPHYVMAVADPCVEAWLYCQPNAFALALEGALDTRFRMPNAWPVPRTERQAKDQLGQLIRIGLGADLLRNGFEYAREIVDRVLAEPLSSPSLSDCVRAIERELEQVA